MSTATQLPWEGDTSLHWYSVYDYALKWRRSPRCVRLWCVDGTLAKWGCSVYRDRNGRWWIGERGNNGNTGNRSSLPL